MVTQLQPGPTVYQAAGQGLQNAILPSLQREIERGQVQRGLSEIKNRSSDNPKDTLFSLIEAATLSPEIGRSLGPLYQTLMQEQNQRKTANTPLTGSQNQRQQPQQPQGQIGAEGRAPSEQAQKFFPNNYQPNQAPGNAPQEATRGLVKPILDGDELIYKAQDILGKWNKVGISDRTFDDALKVAQIQNEGNKEYNQQVERERQNRIAEQEAFGNVAEETLTKVLPGATDEQKALFRKKGEDAAGQGKSQADIKRILAKEATKFKNNISNIEKALNAPRIQNQLTRSILGTHKTLEQAEKDARAQVKPLIDEGLYDTSRTLLSKAGFYPEERERIVFGEINPEVKKAVDSIAKPSYLETKPAAMRKYQGSVKSYAPESIENLKQNISQVWGQGENNNMNMLQLRKAYEDNGYNWRIFKDAMNDLFSNGQIELNDDQLNQFNSYLDEPPLNLLEKLLYNLNLRGR